MIQRTESGKSRFGKAFRAAKNPAKGSRYSESYVDSLDFKASGKSKNPINMKLSGDMLGLMEIIDETNNTITVGWNDSGERSKAHGHVTGGGNLPTRDFFGITTGDIAEVKSRFSSELKDIKESRGRAADDAALALIRRIDEEISSGEDQV